MSETLLRNLPQEISRIIYLEWYYPIVMEELKRTVPTQEFYTVQTYTEDTETTTISLVIFRLSGGSFTRMIAQSRTINHLNRVNRLKEILGWPFNRFN